MKISLLLCNCRRQIGTAFDALARIVHPGRQSDSGLGAGTLTYRRSGLVPVLQNGRD